MKGFIGFRVIVSAVLLITAAGCTPDAIPTFVGEAPHVVIQTPPAKRVCTAIERESIPECDPFLGKPDTLK